VRQLWDQKGSAVVEVMTPNGMNAYAQICGGILARAHARSGDAIAIGAYLGKGDSFDQAITRFATPTPTRTIATTPRLRPPSQTVG
jgi:hypothetical protein